MTPWLLAVMMATGGELWAGTSGFDAAPCDSSALARAIRAQRPATSVHPWRKGDAGGPSSGGIVVSLEHAEAGSVLEVTGAGAPIRRTLPANDTCERTVEIAAQIVDAALDDLRTGEAPQVESVVEPAPPVPLRSRFELDATLGGGVTEGAGSFAGALGGGFIGRYRFLELTLDADVALPTTTTVTTTRPESVQSGTVSVTELAVELGVGLAPRLGPGRGFVDVVGGVAVWLESFNPSATSPGTASAFFHATPSTAEEAFVGLRLGYALDLPRRFFLAVRLEERLAPAKMTFDVQTAQSTLSGVTTPTTSFTGMGLLGYRFL